MRELRGKSVLVTGASSGIGLAVASAFAKVGCRVALAARRFDLMEELSHRLSREGCETLVIPCDLRDRRQALNAVESVIRSWGRLDILINNAGISKLDFFERQNLDEVDDVIATNLLGAIYTTHAAIRHMRRQRQGHILNVASLIGITGLPWMAAYSASKFGVVGFTESLRRELYNSGITLTAFCPGTVDTAMSAEPLKDPQLRKTIRPKTPEQVAEKIVQAVRCQTAEVIYGEVPALILYLLKFFPRFSDWLAHRLFSRLHPQVRSLLAEVPPAGVALDKREGRISSKPAE